MTLDQKIGQTAQADMYSFSTPNWETDPTYAAKLQLGSVLAGGNGCPD